MRAVVAGLVALLLAAAPFAAWGAAAAVEYRSVGAAAAILYDGPSVRSPKLLVVNRGYPLEVIVALDDWTKVRDATGAMSWIETARLTDQRTVMVKVGMAPVRQRPYEAAPVVYQAQQNVILELVEAGSGGWLQVRHPQAGTGFLRVQQIWGG